jgi:peptidoglycan/LPS O-acetylase OafA/YrhL
MRRERRWRRRLIILAATVAASTLTFELLLLLDPPPWTSSEHIAIAVWTLPLGLLVVAMSRLLRRVVGHRATMVKLIVLPPVAAIVAIVWTLAAVVISGGYALAFDVSPLWCWFVGSLAGLATALFGKNSASSPTPSPIGEQL